MKKIIFSSLSFLLIGTICFADNIKDYKKIILNDENKQVFTELKTSLEEAYNKSNQSSIGVAADNLLQTEQNPKAILWNNYPEFSKTEFEAKLTDIFSKVPDMKIKNFSFSGMEGIFTITNYLGKEEHLIVRINKTDRYYTEISDLWNKNRKLLKEYRSLLRVHAKMLEKVRTDIKNYSGKPYKGYIEPKCIQEISVVDLRASRCILCQPYSDSGKKPIGKLRYFGLESNSSKLYVVNNNLGTALQNFYGKVEEVNSAISLADTSLVFSQASSDGNDDIGPLWTPEAERGKLMILPKDKSPLPKPDYLVSYGGYYCVNQLYKKIGLSGLFWKEIEGTPIKQHVAKMPDGQRTCDAVFNDLSESLIKHLSEIQ